MSVLVTVEEIFKEHEKGRHREWATSSARVERVGRSDNKGARCKHHWAYH